MELESYSQQTFSWHHRLASAGGRNRDSRSKPVNSSIRIPDWNVMKENESREGRMIP